MHNRIGFNRLDRKSSHRKALHRNMVTSLIKYERIETTKAKAKEIRRTAEKLVTRAKVDSVHNRRIVAKTVYEKDALNKLFTEVGPRFTERPGGYTRIFKLGRRPGDAAEMVILEFLKEDEAPASGRKKSSAKKSSAKKSADAQSAKKKEAKAEAKPAESKAESAEAQADAVEEAKGSDKPVDEKPAEAKAGDEDVKAQAAESKETVSEPAEGKAEGTEKE